MITPEELGRMDACAPLLGEAACTVVRQLIAEIQRLTPLTACVLCAMRNLLSSRCCGAIIVRREGTPHPFCSLCEKPVEEVIP